MRIKKKVLSLFVFFLLIVLIPFAHAQTPQETLNQYISDLQNNPNDYALREKIIKFVQEMKPAPPVPEEARRHYVMALTLFKGAKKVEDYSESIEEFRGALLIAPWWADANRDLGMALEAAKRYDDAISALKLYMVSGLGEEKARAAQDEIYKIEGMKKLAAREREESSPAAIAEKKRETEKEFIEKLNGAHYSASAKGIHTIDIQGNKLIFRSLYKDGSRRQTNEVTLNGRESNFMIHNCHQVASDGTLYGEPYSRLLKAKISDDGNSITVEQCSSNEPLWTYYRER